MNFLQFPCNWKSFSYNTEENNIWGFIKQNQPVVPFFFKKKKQKLLLYYAGPWHQRWMLMAWQQRLNLPNSISLHAVVWQMAVEGQSDEMVSGMEVQMKRKCETELLHAEKKWHPLTFIDTYWTFMETKQWMWEQWGSGWCISAVVTATVVTSSGADFYKWVMKALVHHWQECIANGGDYAAKWCFVAENLLYHLVLLCSFYLW